MLVMLLNGLNFTKRTSSFEISVTKLLTSQEEENIKDLLKPIEA